MNVLIKQRWRKSMNSLWQINTCPVTHIWICMSREAYSSNVKNKSVTHKQEHLNNVTHAFLNVKPNVNQSMVKTIKTVLMAAIHLVAHLLVNKITVLMKLTFDVLLTTVWTTWPLIASRPIVLHWIPVLQPLWLVAMIFQRYSHQH